MKGGPFALSFHWRDLALLALVVSVKSGLFSVRSVVWRKKGYCKNGAFLLNKKRRLKNKEFVVCAADQSVAEQILTYNRANREVAILCNHQRSVPKSHDKSMENLNNKMKDKQQAYLEARKEYKAAKEAFKNSKLKKDKELVPPPPPNFF